MKKLNLLISLAFLGLVMSCQPTTENGEQEETGTIEYDSSITLPDNFQAAVVAEGLGRTRHIAVRSNGDVYAQLYRLKDGKGLVALRDTDGDVKADVIQYFGDHQGTGCHIYQDFLYCSSPNEVFRYPLQAGELLPDTGRKEMIAGGFPEQSQHAQKSLAFDMEGNLYVNVGAPSNACQEQARTEGSMGMDPCPQLERQGSIWKFSATTPGQQQMEDATRYATGIRNAVALTWNPTTNSLFAMQHGRDQLHQLWPDLYTEDEGVELPAEEFLSISEGDDFGWPYCYYNHLESKKMLAPEYGGDGSEQGRCADVKPPIMGFPGHMAPNDLLFYTGDQFPERYRNGAFIAFHGSWNRAPQEQKGYFVVFVPMENGVPSGDWEVFAEGFAGYGTINSPRDANHRPCGLAQGPDGSLYVSDDVEGNIWKITYGG